MSREDVIDSFKNNEANPLHIEKMKELRTYINENFDDILAGIVHCFKEIFIKIESFQRESEDKLDNGEEKTAFVALSALRSGVKLKNSRCLLTAYNKNWYADAKPVENEYLANWLFSGLSQYERELEETGKKYAGAVTRYDVEKIAYDKFPEYIKYLTAVCRKCADEIASLEEFRLIKKNDLFDIRVGEYFDLTESVWLEDESFNIDEDVKKFFEQKYDYAYVFRHYKDLDISRADYSGVSMMRSRFQNVSFAQCDMGFCNLKGAKFLNCDMDRVNLTGSDIAECNFTGSSLNHANLTRVNCAAAPGDDMAELFFIKTSFKDARLNSANLSYGNFADCDFRGADLHSCDFTGANLKGAVIDNEYKNNETLTDDQKGDIIWL